MINGGQILFRFAIFACTARLVHQPVAKAMNGVRHRPQDCVRPQTYPGDERIDRQFRPGASRHEQRNALGQWASRQCLCPLQECFPWTCGVGARNRALLRHRS